MNKIKKVFSIVLAIAIIILNSNEATMNVSANEQSGYITLYLIDNTKESWIANDNAKIVLVDNSSGHTNYNMARINDSVWSVDVPESASNITFNRLNPSDDTQWNSWSAGGRDSNNAYYADGSEYGHWGHFEETEEFFHAGDIVFLDFSEFASWNNDNAVMYVNFTSASKVENNNADILLNDADTELYNPRYVFGYVEENVFAYILSEEDEGAEELRFWRGSEDILWNCSSLLTYEAYKNGNNCVKISGWNDAGTVCSGAYEINIDADSDNDGLPNFFEHMYACGVNISDTDNDGLTDGQEVLLISSNPAVYDSIETGVSDAHADIDDDGLTNIEEINLDTMVYRSDTDNDGLYDGEEVKTFFTNPLIVDTDGDTLSDYDDIKLSWSPLLQDTDEDGILDCDETLYQSIDTELHNQVKNGISKVRVTFEGTGYINSNTSVKDIYGKDVHTSNVIGLVSSPVEISSTSEFEEAMIEFEINTDNMDTEAAKNLLILWYDEENDTFVPQETQVDLTNMIVKTTVSHFSKYMVVDKTEWYEGWRDKVDYEGSNNKIIDTVIAIDCSGSMSWNDPDFTYVYRDTLYPGSYYEEVTNYRKLASENYISAMGVTDKVSVVLFANSSVLACGLTNSRMTAIETLGDIYSEGGTNFESAISMSLDVLGNSENAEKTILLLSDGESTVSNSTISQAIANGIKINTVYIGEEENSTIMENIAIQTNGESYIATTADELIDIYSEINVIQRFDMTDSDSDGLADIFEISGMKLSNGQIIYTDPFVADTDNDGLLDGEEIKPMPSHKKEVVFDNVGRGEEIWSYVFKMYTNPNLKDTDGDFDEDFIDPDSSVYQLNGRLIENIDELYNLAVDYQKIKNLAVDEYTIDVEYWFVFMFIRQFNPSYVGNNWDGTGCPIDTDFVEYVKQENLELYDYFANTNIYYANEKGDEGDLYHMAATMTALIFKSDYSYGLKFGAMPEYHIDRLAGWAGDLQSVMSEIAKQKDENGNFLYVEYLEFRIVLDELIGFDSKTDVKSYNMEYRFNMNDVFADVDAENLFDILERGTHIEETFFEYFEEGYEKRFTTFTKGCGRTEIWEITNIYAEYKYLNLVKWPLLKAVSISEEQSYAATDAYTDFLMEMIENE